jgi:hypothetical protein
MYYPLEDHQSLQDLMQLEARYIFLLRRFTLFSLGVRIWGVARQSLFWMGGSSLPWGCIAWPRILGSRSDLAASGPWRTVLVYGNGTCTFIPRCDERVVKQVKQVKQVYNHVLCIWLLLMTMTYDLRFLTRRNVSSSADPRPSLG